MALNVTASYGTLHVDATRARTCFREVSQFVEHHEQIEPGIFAGPLIVAGIGVANALESESWIEDRSLRVTASDCPVAAGGAVVEVALPSGAVVRARTDARGLAHVKIPAGEPARGLAIVRAGDAAVRIAYAIDGITP